MPSYLAAHALTNAARCKERLNIPSATTTWDALIERLINAATDYLERTCGKRRFKKTTYTLEVHHGGDGTMKHVTLDHWPVTALSAAQYRAGDPATPVWTAFDATEYELINDKEPRRIRIYSRVPAGQNNLRFTYAAGYDIDFANETDLTKHTLPAEVSDFVERLVIAKFKGRDSEGKANEAGAEASVSWARTLTDEDKELLRQLKGVNFG
jgi:hypothetical protein